MLAEEGYDVVGQAGDGQTAVELAEQHRPDLVVLDVKMPKLDGIAAAQRIAEQRIAPVVILTAFSQRDLVDRARDAGAMAYLVKPFTKSDLVPAIEMAVSRFAELQLLEAEVADLTERLETRKAVDRAKGVLQRQLEPQRAGRVPLDPEDRHGPAPVDAPGGRRRDHPRPGPSTGRTGDRRPSRPQTGTWSAVGPAGHEMATTAPPIVLRPPWDKGVWR